MKNFIFKIKCLLEGLSFAFERWQQEVWSTDLDDFHCCSGGTDHDPCGCHGATNREVISWQYLQK